MRLFAERSWLDSGGYEKGGPQKAPDQHASRSLGQDHDVDDVDRSVGTRSVGLHHVGVVPRLGRQPVVASGHVSKAAKRQSVSRRVAASEAQKSAPATAGCPTRRSSCRPGPPRRGTRLEFRARNFPSAGGVGVQARQKAQAAPFPCAVPSGTPPCSDPEHPRQRSEVGGCRQEVRGGLFCRLRGIPPRSRRREDGGAVETVSATGRPPCQPDNLPDEGSRTSPADPMKIMMTTTQEPRMPFGRYRGKPVSEVLRQDPSYLTWFCDPVEGTSCQTCDQIGK